MVHFLNIDMAPFCCWPYMRLIHAHIMLVNLHLYNLIKVSFRYHFWDSYRAIMLMYAVHFMGQSVCIKLELLHILMDGHSAVLSNEIKLERRLQTVEEKPIPNARLKNVREKRGWTRDYVA